MQDSRDERRRMLLNKRIDNQFPDISDAGNSLQESRVLWKSVVDQPMHLSPIHSSSSPLRGVGSFSIHSSLPAFSRCLRRAP